MGKGKGVKKSGGGKDRRTKRVSETKGERHSIKKNNGRSEVQKGKRDEKKGKFVPSSVRFKKKNQKTAKGNKLRKGKD